MSNIVRDSDVVELDAPPYFTFGEKVRAKRTIRNDGTYAGKEIGDVLCARARPATSSASAPSCSNSTSTPSNSSRAAIASA